MKAIPPLQSLLLLVLAGVALGGWLYGLHWKRVASGDLFTSDEKMMIRLQDQIGVLDQENAKLRERLRELGGESESEEGAPSPPGGDGAEVPPLGPFLPAPPQRIETH